MIYVISDIHGDYPSFYKMLLKINFSSSDSLCILGDVVDKGSDNLYLLEFMRRMKARSMKYRGEILILSEWNYAETITFY